MMEVSAQVNLYPLRQQEIGTSIDGAIAALRGYAVKLEMGAMSTTIAGDIDAVSALSTTASQRPLCMGRLR